MEAIRVQKVAYNYIDRSAYFSGRWTKIRGFVFLGKRKFWRLNLLTDEYEPYPFFLVSLIRRLTNSCSQQALHLWTVELAAHTLRECIATHSRNNIAS